VFKNNFLDVKEKKTITLKHRKRNEIGWTKQEQNFNGKSLVFFLTGELCQVYEVRFQVPKKKEQRLPDIHFGRKNSIEELRLSDIQSNSVKVRWNGTGHDCASGFKIR